MGLFQKTLWFLPILNGETHDSFYKLHGPPYVASTRLISYNLPLILNHMKIKQMNEAAHIAFALPFHHFRVFISQISLWFLP